VHELMKKIDLVFRTVGERTSAIALDLAINNIQPHQVHLIEDVKPFSEAVNRMLTIDYDCDAVVFMDADCLIMEDMQPFLQHNDHPYVDCFVLDKFRGQIHQGVHITRIDVVREMQQVEIPENDLKYVLRPESRIRALALSKLEASKHFKHFRIFHDYFQYYHDIFAKFALRELRSRTHHTRTQLKMAQKYWLTQHHDPDYGIAKFAVDYTAAAVPSSSTPAEIARYIAALPQIAAAEVPKLKLPPQKPLICKDVELQAINQWSWQLMKSTQIDIVSKTGSKVFGIGLSRTGTKSLTSALHALGISVAHYPDDETTLRELIEGNYDFSLLQKLDGITDITVSAFYPQLDKLFPGSKFILTVRDKESWLKSMKKHWSGRPAFADEEEISFSKQTHMNIRRLLRAAVYGCYEFNEERLSYVYDQHYKNVMEYFKSRPESLLVLDICGGQGWNQLCSFLNAPALSQPFPYTKKQSALAAFVQ
jgi:hypothetical protein